MNGRRGAFVAAVSAASAAIASLCYATGFRGVIYDAFHFFTLSRIVSTEGLWNLHSRMRSYGYPLFVSLVTGFTEQSPEVTRALVFAAQLLVYLAASFYAARVAERVFGSPRFFEGTYLVLALNPFALIRSTELLSDQLSAVLVGLSLFLSLERGRPVRRASLAFLSLGFAIAVRPANLVLLPALALLWLLRGRLYGEKTRRVLLPSAAAVALALLPQLLSNVRGYDQWNPLLVDRLYSAQTQWGMAILKYGTIVLPDHAPQLVYRNPFYPDGAANPAAFFAQRPGGYGATLALHGFALVDQDFAFTFITDLKPGLRWPLSVLNYAFLFLALFGLAAGLREGREAGRRLYFSGALAFAVAYVAIYLPVAVENRFSAPLYLLLAPAAVFAVDWLSRRRSGTVVVVAIVGGGFIAVCVQLSIWLWKQAPVLSP